MHVHILAQPGVTDSLCWCWCWWLLVDSMIVTSDPGQKALPCSFMSKRSQQQEVTLAQQMCIVLF